MAAWSAARLTLEGWDVEDVQSNVRNMLFAGSETTTHALASAVYLMMTEPGLPDRIRAGSEKAIRAFVEKTLRLYGPVQYRSRLANRDLTVSGREVRQGQAVVSVQAAANRDPDRYRCPAQIDLERPNPRDHIAFNYGPRTCVGANLARLEMQETVRAVLDRMPDLRLAPDGPVPKLTGLQWRDFRPLHAVFTAGRAQGAGLQLNEHEHR